MHPDLAGNAAAQNAGSAHGLGLDDGDFALELGCADGGSIAAGASADNDYIVHVSRLQSEKKQCGFFKHADQGGEELAGRGAVHDPVVEGQAPTPRMPVWGALMMGVKKSTAEWDMLVTVKVPPDMSSGVS